MIAYFKCLCKASDKLKAAQLRADGIEVRDIRHSLEWRKEARSYGLRLPILVKDAEATQI